MNQTATGTVTCEVCGKKIDERGDYIEFWARYTVCGECEAYYNDEELEEILDI